MKTKTLSLVGASAALLILSIAACQSSDSSADTTPGSGGSTAAGAGGAVAGTGGTAAGTGGTAAGTGGTAAGTGGTAGGAGTAGGGNAGSPAGAGGGPGGAPAGAGGTGGSSCDTNLPSLHPPKGASGAGGAPAHGIYCPFSNAGGGGPKYCKATTEKCCEGAKSGDLSVCSALGDACPQNFDAIECTDGPADCGGAKKCCAKGTFAINPDPLCANFASKFKGTYCADACAPEESEVCTSDDQCGGGKTCHAFKARGGEYGVCK